jgi:hypothetical protein
LLKGLLEDYGIAARVVNDAMQIAGGDLPLGWAAAARVVVSSSDAPQARQIALEFDQQTAHEPTPDDAVSEPARAEWSDWPICPQCSERRAARCPVCGLSGTDFPLADIQDVADGERVLLVCSACDDHFLPEWNRRCHCCGHDYGDGWEAASPVEIVRVTLNPRAIAVAAVMLAGVLALGAYFYFLFSNRAT